MIYREDSEFYKEKIGIIGQGFVGSAITQLLKHRGIKQPLTYDIVKEKCEHWVPIERIALCDYIFVCVPTPMKRDGQCDTRILENAINNLVLALEKAKLEAYSADYSCGYLLDLHVPIVIIKSTIPPGTSRRLSKKFENTVNIVFSPEFLTEANAFQDLKNADRVVWGSADEKSCGCISSCINSLTDFMHGKDTTRIFSDYETAEMSKYFINAFLACKVTFANQMYEIAKGLNINYEDVVEIATLDKRVGKSHLKVPGPDGDFSYGGHCLPKDLESIIYEADENIVNTDFLQSIRASNKRLRKNKDWEQMKGRAVSDD